MELPNHVQCRVEPNRPSLRLSIRDALLVEKLCQEWHRADDDTTGKSKFRERHTLHSSFAYRLFFRNIHIFCSFPPFISSILCIDSFFAEVFTQTHTTTLRTHAIKKTRQLPSKPNDHHVIASKGCSSSYTPFIYPSMKRPRNSRQGA